MRTIWAVACLGFLPAFGCGVAAVDRLGQEKVRLANARADEMEKFVQASDPAVKEAHKQQMKQLQEAFEKVESNVRKLSVEEQAALAAKYDAECSAANSRSLQAFRSLGNLKIGK